MSQALHIFRKDVRHLSLEIGLALVLTALFTYLGVSGAKAGTTPGGTSAFASFILDFLLPLNFAVLTARGVHDEALPGDRQFWLTRPYNRASLIAAKALLVLAFVVLPLTIAQCIIIKAYGFAILDHLPGLLCTQALIIAGCVLPVMALSSITTGFLQALLGAILITAAVALYVVFPLVGGGSGGGLWLRFTWVQTYSLTAIVACASVAIIATMYTRRAPARGIAIAACALSAALLTNSFLPWTAAFALQSALSGKPADLASIRAELASGRDRTVSVFVDPEGGARFVFPLTLTGLPGDLSAYPQRITATVDAPGELPIPISVQGQLFSFQTYLQASFYRRIRTLPVKIRGTLYLTLYDRPKFTEFPFNNRRIAVPEVGNCIADKNDREVYFLTCDAAFRDPRAFVSTWFNSPKDGLVSRGLIDPPSESPFPGELDMNPIHRHAVSTVPFQGPFTEVRIDTIRPVAYVRCPFVITNLRFTDFEVHR